MLWLMLVQLMTDTALVRRSIEQAPEMYRVARGGKFSNFLV